MLIFDQLRKDDPQLRTVTLVVLCGLGVLLGGLWWVQVVSARDYQDSLETQSYRTVRIPGVRGKILDRNGKALAENRPTYNISLYLEELARPFNVAYTKELACKKAELKQLREQAQKRLNRALKKEELKAFYLTPEKREQLRQVARLTVVSNLVAQISQRLGQPIEFNAAHFERHYRESLALPYPIMPNLNATNIARFEEQCIGLPGVDLEMQSTRNYPFGTAAAHLLGYLKQDNDSVEGEEAYFSFRLPDYRGVLGLEVGYDKELRGTAGAKSVLVNNVGYRQAENVWSVAEPGHNITLAIDHRIQQVADHALQTALDGIVRGAIVRGAAVVMDVNTGDIIALSSSPTYNPNDSIPKLSREEIKRRLDPKLRPEFNRATQDNFLPGSIFKPVVAIACLEAGLDPNETIYNPGYIVVGRPIDDLAEAGNYNFRRALIKSSNTYFITMGLRAGAQSIVRIGQRLHLGEKIGLPTRQDTPGHFHNMQRVSARWSNQDTALLCIGQGGIDVTPLQMAVFASAIANGGKVLWPRLVTRIESMDPMSGEPPTIFEGGRVRDNLGVSQRTLNILKDAMLADVEDKEGTGTKAAVPGMRICGKTGTAEKKDVHGRLEEHHLWFLSFAPYEAPRYAVVVMIQYEHKGFGGQLCAPVAQQIYQALQQRDRAPSSKPGTLALAH